MTKTQAKQLWWKLRYTEGFDITYRRGTEIHVGCSQCEAVVINNIACHEHGCPNQRKHK